MRIKRLEEMEDYILRCGNVSLKDLADYYNISINTVRRDIEELLKRGKIKKVYGGVMACATSSIMPFSSREKTNIHEKQSIGQLAAQLIRDNSTVYIDSGTTTAQVVSYLADKSNVTVVTNNLNVIYQASQYTNLKLFTMGGYYNHPSSSFLGINMSENILRLSFDLVLMGATSVSLSHGITINSYYEESMKRLVVQNNKSKIALLADADKYDKSALFSICDFDDINVVISDRELPKKYMDRIKDNNATFICPS